MAITYGYFNSVNGDRKYNADQMSQYFKGLISDGLYENVGNKMAVTADGETMTVKVGTGRAVIGSKWVENDTALDLQITTSHATYDRWTAVIVQLDEDERLIRITTRDGEPAAVPIEPSIGIGTELCLAMIYIPAGSSYVTQARITDKRGTSECLWITGLITQLDSNTLFNQWTALFNEYYASMTSQFHDWFEELSTDLNVQTYVSRFQKSVTISSSNAITLDMTGYTYAATDIIDVYINGLIGVAGTDYTLDTSGASPVVTTTATASGTDVVINVTKSIIGFPTLGTEQGNTLLTESDDPIIA